MAIKQKATRGIKKRILGFMATYASEILHQIFLAGVSNNLKLYDCFLFFC